MTCQLEPLVPVDLFADPWRWKCVHCGTEYGTHDEVKRCLPSELHDGLRALAVMRSIDNATPEDWSAATSAFYRARSKAHDPL